MDSLPKVAEPLSTPPPYFLPEQDVKVYKVHSPFMPPPSPTVSFSPEAGLSTEGCSPPAVYDTPSQTPRAKFVSYEVEPHRSPAPATCPSCRTRVTTQVTFRAGAYAWLACLVFALFGLVFGCCLIPFFVNHFKDAFHTCPRCQLVLHVHRKRCCK
ncbi:lipopolysaccharide-induced tumor necrosis factor-alpha factor homolog [Pholidichthys leucotaenia]